MDARNSSNYKAGDTFLQIENVNNNKKINKIAETVFWRIQLTFFCVHWKVTKSLTLFILFNKLTLKDSCLASYFVNAKRKRFQLSTLKAAYPELNVFAPSAIIWQLKLYCF
jgi:hypothetical protein